MFIQLVDLESQVVRRFIFFQGTSIYIDWCYDENSVYVLGSSKTRDATQSHETWNDVKILIGLTFITLLINLLTIILKVEVVINVFFSHLSKSL